MNTLRTTRRWAVVGALALLFGAGILAPTPAGAQSQTMQRILYGEVLSAERITIQDRPTGRGAQAGSTVGAVAGYALADGRDRWLGAVVGGVLGGTAGNAAEKAKKKKPGWELIILLDNGEEIGVQVPMDKKIVASTRRAIECASCPGRTGRPG